MSQGYVESGAARLAIDREGSGTPVVMLHAGIAELRSWAPRVISKMLGQLLDLRLEPVGPPWS